jgi:hypothetical protein
VPARGARSAWNPADIRGEVEQLIARSHVVADAAVRTDLAEDLTRRRVQPSRLAGEPLDRSSPPVLAADLNAGLKRLKMAAMRRLAPGLLVTAKTQRWSPG